MNWKKKLAIVTAFTGATITTIHIINKVISLNATKEHILMRSSGTFYEWRFGKVFYKKIGIGSPILLIHDFKSFSSSDEWNQTINSLAKDHTVYAIDLLGCGRSDKPNMTYTNYLYVQLITDFIKHIIGQPTDVIATGASSSFVLAACHNEQDIINKIIMVNPVSMKYISLPPSKRTKSAAWVLNVPIIGTLLYHVLSSKYRLRKYINREYFSLPDSYSKTLLDTYYESVNETSAKSKHLYASMVGKYTTLQLNLFLKNLNNSIYIIDGNVDPEAHLIASEYQEILPSIESVFIKGSGGMPQLDAPSEFLENTKLFLS
ncbi:pimeloyl-ACP methyl ester carboxylesterase [Lachnospiraceae bacterium PF1-21]